MTGSGSSMIKDFKSTAWCLLMIIWSIKVILAHFGKNLTFAALPSVYLTLRFRVTQAIFHLYTQC